MTTENPNPNSNGKGQGPNRVNVAIERASQYANDNEHEYVTIEHLLWSLLHEKDVQDIITDAGGKPNIIRNELENFINDNALQLPAEFRGKGVQPGETTALRRVFQRALTTYMFAGRSEVTCIGVVLSILAEENSYASYFLRKSGITKDGLIRHLKKYDEAEKEAEIDEALEEYCRNLNKESKAGLIDPIIGRETE